MPELSYWPADRSSPVLDTTIGSVLRDTAARLPDAWAVIDGDAPDRRCTYAQLLGDAERIATGLLSRFQPGERVAIWGPSSPEWLKIEYGAALAGLGLVTVNPGLKSGELRYVLEQSGAVGIILVDEFRGNPMRQWLDLVSGELPRLRDVLPLHDWKSWAGTTRDGVEWPEVRPDDLVQIHFTSGTTGRPKGAMLHHRGVTNNMRFHKDRLGLVPGDIFLNPTPMFHVGGAVLANLTALNAGACLVPVQRFDAATVLDLIPELGVDAMIGVPTMYIDLVAEHDRRPRPTDSLRVVMVGGSLASPDLIQTLQTVFGASVRNVYGQTECGSIIATTVGDDTVADIAGTVGRPMPQIDVKVVDREGQVVACGAPGELCVRGYEVMHGYCDMPVETKEALDEDGWLRTGDVCTADERGYIRIVSRVKEMIIRGGENIFPAEIEDVIRRHPAVADVAVVGVADSRLGEVVGAVVRLAGRATIEDLRGFAAGLLSREKVPAHWRIVDSFPLTASGKVRKQDLRDTF
ncbi:MAG TPA: AMP-binding protein [Acidimicrobiales bacterium]|jgi:fatty-acyl-CoA synthase|nr:AMP-binding protein [Acidimicrobiales bacterium]